MKKKIIIITFLLFIVDQVTKYFVKKKMINKIIISNLLSLKYTQNKGVAFSFLYGKRIIILFISIILLGIIIKMIYSDYIKKKENNNYKNIMYGMLLAGILGNLFDRVIRGYVVDFISFNIFGYMFPIFNVADILITVSVILILIDEIIKKGKKAI